MRILTSLLFSILFSFSALAQDVIFELANAQQTSSGGNTFYDVDILVSTSSDFKMGSGQLYFDYNPQAFGNSVETNSRVTITTAGFILGQATGPFGIYANFTTNDNSSTRVSFSWTQAFSSGCITADNVTSTATALFHLQLQYVPGGTAFPADVCFTSAPTFDDQTFTACGPTGCAVVDCAGFPGTRITNDAFDCTNAPLPLDLLTFDVKRDQDQNAFARWRTANEVNTSHFDVERSTDTKRWTSIGQVAAAGFSPGEQRYNFLDEGLSQLALQANTAYYRLKMIDQDGAFTYSAIRSLTLERPLKVSIYPNPTVNSVFIETSAEEFKGQTTIRLLNTTGKTVWSTAIDLSSNESRLLEFGGQLVPGVYFLRGEDQSGRTFEEQIIIMKP